ncbi:FlgD immunoglobulin-like domain containing protein [Nocardioides sp. CFH 31398]|uniref:FlgD immunoglobulin-like domain containing protein n=1 Tax=Nocardioides sp. CFH 31398 TaxID=2919579 RepID=UPI001F052FB9|nr:FlgD immunoglobulin-like domain containing protein [Nocardioides sp. CFH 31398]MCH1868346.1 hypothetical protein [Nocardioides sp. CFH 31398]
MTVAPATADPEARPGPMTGFVEGSPGTVGTGWTGPLVVAGFSTTDDFVYRLRVRGPGGYDFRDRFELDEGQSMREEVELSPVTTPGRYRARLDDENGAVDDLRFVVAGDDGPLLTIDQAPPAVFLPRVVDGLRDTATLTFALARPSSVVGEVLDADGRVLRRDPLGRLGSGAAERWTWDGVAAGRVVDRGTYTMRVTASADGRTVTESRVVRVASYRALVDRRVDRAGMTTSSRSPGGCRLAATEGRGLDVDCRGAADGAEVRYWFATGTRAVRWRVDGDGTASRSTRRLGRGTAVVVSVPAGARWRTDRVAAAWQSRVLR